MPFVCCLCQEMCTSSICNTQQVVTRRNRAAKRAHVAPNNVAICCLKMLQSLGWDLQNFFLQLFNVSLNPFMDFVKPFNAFGFPFKRKYKPFKRFCYPFTNRLQSVYFHPFNRKPLVSVFAFQVTNATLGQQCCDVPPPPSF